MNQELTITFMKILFINIFTYLINFKLYKNKKKYIREILLIALGSIFNTIFYLILHNIISHLYILMIMYGNQLIFLSIMLRIKREQIIIMNLISNALTYMVFVLSMIIEIPLMLIFNIRNDIINTIIILFIERILIFLFFKIKRFRKGFSFIEELANKDVCYIVLINVATIMLFMYCLFGYFNQELTKYILSPFILLSVIMLISIQKTLNLYYKQKLLVNTIEDYKTEIAEKDKKIKNLSEEKYKISKLNHEFYHRQKALELKVNELKFSTEASAEIGIVKQINELTEEYTKEAKKIKNPDKLPSTGIEEIDDMFRYMQFECVKNNIQFSLKVDGGIHHMVNKIIPQNKLVTIIGDHLRDAIIAINSSNNKFKSILAIIGKNGETYEFCVYDSGVEFEINTLIKLGKEPITTHENSGGTGIGFMTTFETMKETKSSLIIEEKHEISNNDYTKSVTIKFDGKNEYKIISYRADEIRKKNNDDRIIISDKET